MDHERVMEVEGPESVTHPLAAMQIKVPYRVLQNYAACMCYWRDRALDAEKELKFLRAVTDSGDANSQTLVTKKV